MGTSAVVNRSLLARLGLVPAAIAALLAASAGAASYSDQGLNAYRLRNDWNGELAYARGWVAAEPSNALAYRRLAEVYLQAQDTSHALAALQRAVRAAPGDARSWLILGNVYGWRKQYGDAANALRRAARLDPRNPLAWQNLSAMLAYAGDEAGAIRALDDGIRSAGTRFTSVDWYNYGNRLAIMHRTSDAISCYRHAVTSDASNAAAWNNMGTVYAAVGKPGDARTCYRRAAALNDPLARKNLHLLAERGRHDMLIHSGDMRPAGS